MRRLFVHEEDRIGRSELGVVEDQVLDVTGARACAADDGVQHDDLHDLRVNAGVVRLDAAPDRVQKRVAEFGSNRCGRPPAHSPDLRHVMQQCERNHHLGASAWWPKSRCRECTIVSAFVATELMCLMSDHLPPAAARRTSDSPQASSTCSDATRATKWTRSSGAAPDPELFERWEQAVDVPVLCSVPAGSVSASLRLIFDSSRRHYLDATATIPCGARPRSAG